MGISRTIFGKDIYDLELKDLEDFFSYSQEETSILEFKMGDIQLEKVYIEVSAFLNTEGGILILGAPKEVAINNIKISKGALTSCKNISSQDTLMRSIASNIVPSPIGIKVKTIELDSGKVYVLEIDQSFTPPHQVEGKYFIRLERDSKSAPHGIVEALFFKRQKSNLIGYVDIFVRPNSKKVKVRFSLANDSLIHAENISVNIEMNGISEITGSKNLDRNYDLWDDYFKCNESNIPRLVKRLSVSFELDVILRNDFFGFSFNFYANDSQLEAISGIYNSNSKEYIFLNNSKRPENNIAAEGNVWERFSGMLKQEIKIFLEQSPKCTNVLNVPASPEELRSLVEEIEVDLPLSYILLISITNGFQGYIGLQQLSFFTITELLDDIKRKQIDPKLDAISIGSYENMSINISFEIPDRPEFEWSHFLQEEGFYQRKAATLYEVFDFIKSQNY